MLGCACTKSPSSGLMLHSIVLCICQYTCLHVSRHPVYLRASHKSFVELRLHDVQPNMMSITLQRRKHSIITCPNGHEEGPADRSTIVAVGQQSKPILEDRGILTHFMENVSDSPSARTVRIAGILYLCNYLSPGKIVKVCRPLI